MLIRHLEFFVTLAEERHFGRAADLCGVSQPALSLAIRKLEEDLGATLILRGQRFMGLTAEGEKVLDQGRRILSDYGNLRDDLNGRRKGGLTGRLRLGAIPSAMPLVPAISARFEAKNPLARIGISTLSAEEIADGIGKLALDGGLTWIDGKRRTPRGAAQIIEIPLRKERRLFACRKDHPFAPLVSIAWRDAMTQPLCLTEDAADADLSAAVTCASLDGVLAHLRGGLWCSVVPEGFRGLLARDDDIVLCGLTGVEPPLTLGIVLPKRDPQSPMVRALQDCVAALVADGGLAATGTSG